MQQKNEQNPSMWLCRHNDSKDWRAACENCARNAEIMQKRTESLRGRTCYVTTFYDVGAISQPSKILPLFEKISTTIRRKLKGKCKTESFFVLPLLPETRKNAQNQEEPAIKIEGDAFTLNFYNQGIKVPIVWSRGEAEYAQKEPHFGLLCHVKKTVYPQNPT